jgi:hypothetical protein
VAESKYVICGHATNEHFWSSCATPLIYYVVDEVLGVDVRHYSLPEKYKTQKAAHTLGGLRNSVSGSIGLEFIAKPQ